jgi:hypothetical protein
MNSDGVASRRFEFIPTGDTSMIHYSLFAIHYSFPRGRLIAALQHDKLILR